MRRLVIVAVAMVALLAGRTLAQPGALVSILADLDPQSATGLRIEGLVADREGRLYTVDLESRRLFRIDRKSKAVDVLATLPRPGSGMAFDRVGNLYLASEDTVLRINADRLGSPSFDPAADVHFYATGVPGANALVFDAADNLYVSGGATGTIYRVRPDNSAQPFVTGLRSDRPDQQISTNGLQFGPDGRLYSANTGTGAIDRISVNGDGSAGPVERFVTHPLLLGADGIVFAPNGDLFVAANERNAIVRVMPDGTVSEIATNPNTGPLEFPASLAIVDGMLYASNFDLPRGANAPSEPGIGASIVGIDVGLARPPLPAAQVDQPTATAVTPLLTGTTTLVAPTSPISDTVPVSPTTGLPSVTGPVTTTTVPISTTVTIPVSSTASLVVPTTDPAILLPPAQPPTPIPVPTGGAVARLPDTGRPTTFPWRPLLASGALMLVLGLALRRRQRVR